MPNVTQTVPNYRWSVSEFLRAWEAEAFDHRVELIEGELWPVVIGDWHGRLVGTVIGALLSNGGGEVTCTTLPSAGSLPTRTAGCCVVARSQLVRLVDG